MATKNVTFDPDAGVPKGVNLTIHTGSDFTTNFNVVNTSNAAFDLTGYSGSSAMSKSVAVGPHLELLHRLQLDLPVLMMVSLKSLLDLLQQEV